MNRLGCTDGFVASLNAAIEESPPLTMLKKYDSVTEMLNDILAAGAIAPRSPGCLCSRATTPSASVAGTKGAEG